MRKRDIYSNYKEYELESPYEVTVNPTEGDALRDKEQTLDEFEKATIASEPVLGAKNQPVPRETVLPNLVLDESLFEEDVTPKYFFPEGCTYKVNAHTNDGQIMCFETQSIVESWDDFKNLDEGNIFLEECGSTSEMYVDVYKYDDCGVTESYHFDKPIIVEDACSESNKNIDTIIINDIKWVCEDEKLPKSLMLGIEDYTNEEEFREMVFSVLKKFYDCEVVSFDYDNDNLPTKEVNEELVELGEVEFEQLRDIFSQYGFVVESENDNLFGGHHFQIINTDEGFENEGEIKEFVRAMIDDIKALSEKINCPITCNYSVGIPITAGVDIREKYVDANTSWDDINGTLSEEYKDSDIESDKEIKVVINNKLVPLTVIEVSEKSRDGSQKVTFELSGKTKQMWMEDFLKFINASDKDEE